MRKVCGKDNNTASDKRWCEIKAAKKAQQLLFLLINSVPRLTSSASPNSPQHYSMRA